MRRAHCHQDRTLTSLRFIDSEADLDAALKALLPLAQAPLLAYPELVKTGALARLVGLLSHENADIALDVVEVIHELTDEEVGNEIEEEEEGEGTREEALKMLIEGLVGLSRLQSSSPPTNALRRWKTRYSSCLWTTSAV